MSFDRSELIAVFLAEVNEQLQLLEQDILKLEREGESPQTIQSIFRVAHTLKGSSAAMGYIEMKQLTHEMENILDKIRNHALAINGQVVDVLFTCLDRLSELKGEIESGRGRNTRIDDVVAQLRLLEKDRPQAADVPKPARNDHAGWTIEQASKLMPGQRCWVCTVTFYEQCEMKLARAYIAFNQLKEVGDVLASNPDLEDGACSTDFAPDVVSYIVVSELTPEQIKDKINHLLDMKQIDVVPLEQGEPPSPQSNANSETDKKSFEASNTAPMPKEKAEDEIKKVGQTIRVDVERLESLMNLVGELVIDQTRIAQAGHVLRELIANDEALDDLDQISNHISRVIGELQESVMKTRMLPIDQLFSRFPRMVRDLSKSLDKNINLVIEGRETELDRTVIEEISDPLLHLIRNSIDHGIEEAGERRSLGKPAQGTVRISAHHQENQVVLTIEDDGAGIHADKVKQSAMRKGLITAQQAEALTEQEIKKLIFMPGFSTASTVSDISGRGVGMDIVRSHIEKLNGIIDLESVQGKGTKFTIKLPLTLAILRGLLIKLRETTYALPMSSVIEIVRLPKKEIQSIKGQTVVKIRDQVHPLIWLHDHFKLQRSKRRTHNVFVVIIGIAEKRVGLVVDELIGNQEIVVKSIGSYVGKIEGVSGATILGDGSVALILDITGIGKLVHKERSYVQEETEEVV
ncbi:chemotaxis protein CheA [Paenibacillus sp. GD4]|uniref:chemotaxis protein CheA n=1 Tax=Paenibacillus sp. GD4 TaxID=3068890 RepID=UPI002796BABC|nr:chemotaxis protein CheA [Paenibacillus sp. GD4]MDQ1912913.1 chemotaxis protein CheA [Paenibacillus sp. GD4]